MSDSLSIERKEASFSSDSQLLSELGERLIATPEVALAELVKNAYDADATKANVWLEDSSRAKLVIRDNGHGMTEEEFLAYWMRIGTTNKLSQESSKRYARPITGSKGVGRFAVRRLGRSLSLVSVADTGNKRYEKLSATFRWDAFKGGKVLNDVKIPYTLEPSDAGAEGTTLMVEQLYDDWSGEKLREVTRSVLDLISSPFADIRTHLPGSEKVDPGFSLYFSPPGSESAEQSAASELYDRFLARIVITVKGPDVRFEYEYERAKPRVVKVRLREENLVGDVHGEIRYFPKRAGRFAGLKTIDGRRAISWLREHGGVRVIDRQFRLLPYGEADDDWLKLSASKAVNAREWGSAITKALYPEGERSKLEAQDPLLKVPGNHQLMGAIFVESYRPSPHDPPEVRLRRLQPAMDRQGFVENDGFNELRSIVRAGVEILAVIDVEETARLQKEVARERTRELKRDIQHAIRRVEANPEISTADKRDITRSYQKIAREVTKLDEAHERARRTIESMALLGVLAAFMTHEATQMLSSAKRMLAAWKEAPKALRGPEYDELVDTTARTLKQIEDHLDYTRVFIGDLRNTQPKSFKVAPQVELVKRQFEEFTSARGIRVVNNVPERLMSPSIGVSVYSGILVNLFTNAVKAVIALKQAAHARTVQIDAFEEDTEHILRVSDTGIGILFENRSRIFDPVFSTTGTIEGPLGTGLGLGLHIVRTLVTQFGGTIAVVDPPEGFTTCFEVRLPK